MRKSHRRFLLGAVVSRVEFVRSAVDLDVAFSAWEDMEGAGIMNGNEDIPSVFLLPLSARVCLNQLVVHGDRLEEVRAPYIATPLSQHLHSFSLYTYQ
ncbi:hypothetical protein G7K_3441-t1 [Saitoella complicata NRRL Y-17804]|uniref:Uncharacterized protein n=1 Tax=Saitoella complicata (strain BCRC 22490 / CBS 7301 / JCM 7358 / NBRC 10748 / NRRL Y-17804) TaxID=698492 RepID=A0A0E9NHH6_SAICN|nr:hypothetical protein G7K_3441-t1 [Saitoella complicata NRRL Y-17804]